MKGAKDDGGKNGETTTENILTGSFKTSSRMVLQT